MIKVKKRDGRIVDFDKSKIQKAILKAMKNGSGIVKENIAVTIADEIEEEFKDVDCVEIKDIEAEVFNKLVAKRQKLTARAYEGYRSVREFQREHNTIDASITGLFDGSNLAVLSENSNKNERLISTSRDLVAEEVSKDYAKRNMLPPHIVTEHGSSIYLHDLGHYMNPSFNCIDENGWIDIKQNGKIKKIQLKDLYELFEITPTFEGELKEIFDKVYIKDSTGWTKIRAIMARKTKNDEKLYTIKTNEGSLITCTGEHRIPVIRNSSPILLTAKDIKLTDKLIYINKLNTNFNYFDLTELESVTEDIRIINLEKVDRYLKYEYDTCLFALSKELGFDRFSHSKYKLYLKDLKKIIEKYPIPFELYSQLRVSIKNSKHSFPLVIPYSEDLAKLYAYIYADGGVYVNEQQSNYTLTFTNTNLKLIYDFIECFENVFDERLSVFEPSNNSPCYRVTIGSRLLTYLFKDFHGAKKENASNMSIPDFVLNGTRQIKLAYLSASIDTDGSISTNLKQIDYATVSETYANQIKDLIISLGYNADVKMTESKGTEYMINGVEGTRNYNIFRVKVYAKDFDMLCTELSSLKLNKFCENLSVEGFEKLPSTSIISIEENTKDTVVVDIQTDSNYLVVNNYLVHNCCLVNLKDMLDNGTCINGKLIESPHKFTTACTITTQIVAQVASGQFGGQTITLSHLAPYLRKSKVKIEKTLRAELEGIVDESIIQKLIKERLQEELTSGVQTFNYQVNTLQTSNGQSPFLSVFMYIEEDPEYEVETAMIIEEFLKQRYQGMKNEVGAWITPAFPKLLYVTTPNNIYEGSKYYYITELAAKCIAKRMMPDLISEKQMKLNYEGNVFPCMGCRAWLSPYKGGINNVEGQYKWYGRFNMGLTSINLPDVALSADGDIDEFWKIFDERLDLCKESLLLRYNKLKNVTSDVSPIHYQYGAIARLPKGAPIRELLQDNYATITLGLTQWSK